MLLIELLLNKDHLEESLKVEPEHYSLTRLDVSVLERLLVDLYSIVLEDQELTQSLLTLRTQIRLINNETDIFNSRLAFPTTGQAQIVRDHDKFLKQKAAFLLPLVEKALGLIEKRFGLRDPFALASK